MVKKTILRTFIAVSLGSSLLASTLLGSSACTAAEKSKLRVNITTDLPSITVIDHGKSVVIMRNQNPDHTVNPDYAMTSRDCPPFCIQPMQLLPGVHTIGELEMLQFLKKKAEGDKSIEIIDSRTPDWYRKGTIPSAVNIPWTQIYRGSSSYEPLVVESLLTDKFNAKVSDGIWDFRGAKTLVLFCNGPWCGQSPTNIKELVSMGYPADKIYWYRGGMQSWSNLGLTTIQPPQ
jgi:rhodanese-related sulfurtransferase